MFEDTKEVIKTRKSKKGWKYHYQMTKDKQRYTKQLTENERLSNTIHNYLLKYNIDFLNILEMIYFEKSLGLIES